MALKVTLVDSFGKVPVRATPHSAGLDLFSSVFHIVPHKGRALIKTSIVIEIPHGHYGRIAPRSSLAWRSFIDVGAGVIDEDYRGEILVLLFNHSNEDFIISPGDRIAQLIITKISYPEIEVVERSSETIRGEGGFGSTGK